MVARSRRAATWVAALAVLLGAPVPAFADPGVATNAAPLPAARDGMRAIGIANGRVLVVGGEKAAGDTAVVYDPVAGSWTATAPHATERRVDHALARLADGRVLVVGGTIPGTTTFAPTVLYDPQTNVWSAVAGADDRDRASAVTLPDGRVLVVGGAFGWQDGRRYTTATVYDPAAGTWTATPWLHEEHRGRGSAALLGDGSVLFAGVDTSVERWSPGTNTWTRAAPPEGMPGSGALVAVPGGALLVTSSGPSVVFTTASGTWRTVGGMRATSRPALTTATTVMSLTTGEVLVSGGLDPADTTSPEAEIYDPDTGLWRDAAVMARRHRHVAAAVGTRDVLLVAGTADGTSVERFAPPAATTTTATDSPATNLDIHVSRPSGDAGRAIAVVTRLFDAAERPVAGERVVLYERATGDEAWRQIGEGVTDVTGYVAVQVAPARTTTYTARHPATAAAGASASVDVTYEVVDPAPEWLFPPDAALAQAGNGSARVSWLPPAHERAAAVTAYRVFARQLGNPVSTRTVSAATRSTTLTNLTNGYAYEVVVSAVYSDGNENAVSAGTVRPRSTAPAPRAPVAGASLCGRLPLGDTRLTGTYNVCELGVVVPLGARLFLDGATLRFVSPTDRETTMRHGLSVRGGEVRASAGATLRGIDGVAGEWAGIEVGLRDLVSEPWWTSVRRYPDAVALSDTSLSHVRDGVAVYRHVSWVGVDGVAIADASRHGLSAPTVPVHVSDLDVARVGGNGVEVGCSPYRTRWEPPCPVDLNGVRVDRAAGRGLSVQTPDAVSVRGVVVTNSGHATPIAEAARFLGVTASYGGAGADIEDVTGGGNALNAVVLDGTITNDLAWRTPVNAPASAPAVLGLVAGSITMAPGRSATFPPGSVVKAYSPRESSCGGCEGAITVTDGAIDAARGTVFTSVSDASAGIGTCPSTLTPTCDVATTAPWWGLVARGTSRVTLDGTSVRYAGTGLVVDRGPTTVTGSTFLGNRTGVDALGYPDEGQGPITLADTTFTRHTAPVAVSNAASFTATRVRVTDAEYGVAVSGRAGSCSTPVAIRDLVVEDVRGSGLGLTDLCHPVVRGLVVRRSGSEGAYGFPDASPAATFVRVTASYGPGGDVEGLTGGGNAIDAVALNGVATGDLTWVSPVNAAADHALGYIVGAVPEHDTGLTVDGGDLTVPAGALVAAMPGGYGTTMLTVRDGSLDATAGGARFVSLTDPLAAAIGCGTATCASRPWGPVRVVGSGTQAGDLRIAGATIRGAATNLAGTDGVLSVTDTTSDSAVSAYRPARAEVLRSRAASVTVTGAADATVSGTTVTGPGRAGVVVTGRGGDSASRVVLRDNVASGVDGPGFVVGATRASFGPGRDVDGNAGAGDAAVVALADVTATSDVTWLSPTNDDAVHPAGYVVGSITDLPYPGLLTVPGPYRLTFPSNAVAKVNGSIVLRGGTLDATAGGLLLTDFGDDSAGVRTCGRAYRDPVACLDPDARELPVATVRSEADGSGTAGGIAFAKARVYAKVIARGPAADAPGAPGFGLAMDETFVKGIQSDGVPASLTRTHVRKGDGIALAHSTGNVVRDVLVEDAYLDGIDLLDATADVRETVVRGAGRREEPAGTPAGALRLRGTSTGTFSCLDLRSSGNGLTALGAPVTLTDSVLTGNTTFDLHNDTDVTTQGVWWGQPGGPLPGQVKDPARHVDQAPGLVAPSCATAAAATPPTAARSVAATPGDGSVAVTWAAPSLDGRSPVTAYRVSAGGSTVEVPGDRRAATVGGLANGTARFVTVTAVNAVGAGPASRGVTVTPGVPAPASPAAQPTPTPTPTPTTTPAATPPAPATLHVTAPGFITYGASAVVRGSLATAAGPATGRRVDLLTRRRGTTTWIRSAVLTTSSTGAVAYTLRTKANVEVVLSYGGDATTLPARSGLRVVRVRPVVTAGLSRSTVALGTAVTLYGRVAPNLAGTRVTIERYTSAGWQRVTSVTLSSTSTYRFAVRPGRRGSYSYRVVYAATTSHARGVSPTRVLRVT